MLRLEEASRHSDQGHRSAPFSAGERLIQSSEFVLQLASENRKVVTAWVIFEVVEIVRGWFEGLLRERLRF